MKVVEEVIDAIKSVEKVIDFLIVNKNDWSIEGNNIYFHSQKFADQYNKMLKT